jgi:hypothetical protein
VVHEGDSRMFGPCVEARAEVEFDRKTWVFFFFFFFYLLGQGLIGWML